MVFLKESFFLKKLILKKDQQTTKSMKKYPVGKELKGKSFRKFIQTHMRFYPRLLQLTNEETITIHWKPKRSLCLH